MSSLSGNDIGYRHWAAASPRAVFLLVHGLGSHGGRWEAMGSFFMKRAVSSYAVELAKAGGDALPDPGSQNIRSYYLKVLAAYEMIRRDNPGRPVFIIGESLGGIIALLLAADRPELFAGIVLISPAFANRLVLKPSFYLEIFTSYFLNPGKKFMLPFNSSMCTRDEAYARVMDEEPVGQRLSPPRLLVGVLAAQMRATAAARRLTIPALFLLAGKDSISDPKAAERAFASIRAEDKKLITYPDMFHSLSIDLEKEKVFGDVLGWVESRI